ncbi:MAG: segregation/condensation protein A [Alphaproteobacteria bacterium]|nr:segregation/condensation protein A [Alphaproteobacteria bacterium]
MTAEDTEQENAGSDVAADASWDRPERLSGEADRDQLTVDVGGFEGPLDLLLALARTQKVDLANISVLALAEQYLLFIAEARTLRLEVAAEYLVMAAWLAFLKSKLLLPRDDKSEDVASAEELAQRLAFRLMRLEAMRERAAQLMTRSRLGRDVFSRGMPERVKAIRQRVWGADINDLLQAYASSRQRNIKTVHTVRARKVWSIKQARGHLQKLIGRALPGSWSDFDRFLIEYLPASDDRDEAKTVRASSFGATLEMAREGLVELRQDGPFQPIYMRRREGGVWGDER